jgi:hypothetical protein
VVPGSNRGLLPRPCIENQTDVDGIAGEQQRNREPSNNHQVRGGHNFPTTRAICRTQDRIRATGSSFGCGRRQVWGLTAQVELANLLFAQGKRRGSGKNVSGLSGCLLETRPRSEMKGSTESTAARNLKVVRAEAVRLGFVSQQLSTRRPKSKRCPTNPQLRERTSRSLKKKQPPKDSF